MAKFKVIAEFFDVESKQRRLIGDIVEIDEKRAKELKEAGVIGLEVEKKEETPKRAKKRK